MDREIVIIAGALAQRPGYGGHAWVFLQYLLGFRRLGWEVMFLDRLEPEMCHDDAGRICPPERSVELRWLREVLCPFELEDSFALLYDHGSRCLGLPRTQLLECARRSALLLNVMGYCTDEVVLGLVSRRVFLDIDPGFGQMWQALGLHDPFRGHDEYVTIGENIGLGDCAIPTCGRIWHTTPQPVVLDEWPMQRTIGGKGFTSVASWRGSYGPVVFQGQTYGLRVHEFRRFASLPVLCDQRFRLALDIHADEVCDQALLTGNGWILLDPRVVAGNPHTYRAFIQASRAEFMVAKQMYVRANSGWLSDRSMCYLASGRPVLAQDTGIGRRYPTGVGLLTFRTLDEAQAGVEAIAVDYARHADAAREIAETYFDSDKVLSQLLRRLGL